MKATTLLHVLALRCLMAATKTTAMAWNGSSLSAETYVESEAASAYRGEQLQVDLYSSFASDFDLDKILSFKSTVLRLHENVNDYGAIQFNPQYVLMDGSTGGACRAVDGSALVPLSYECEQHCMNHGRYCDRDAFMPPKIHKHNRNDHRVLKGYQRVAEVARRICIWKEYGKKDPKTFFHYFEAMKATGCDLTLKDNCVEQAVQSADMDYQKIHKCMGAGEGLHQTLDAENSILEPTLENRAKVTNVYQYGLPILMINDKQVMKEYGWSSDEILRKVCQEFPSDGEKPQICPFCNEFCPQAKNSSTVVDATNLCLWELKCADTAQTTFEKYVLSINLTEAGIVEAEQEEEIQWAVLLVATFITGCGLLMAIMGLRVWRTKRIVERYVREQKKERHQDPLFFPDDAEFDLDLDLEPAMQYGDVLGVSRQKERQPTGPPSTPHVWGASARHIRSQARPPSTSKFLPHIDVV